MRLGTVATRLTVAAALVAVLALVSVTLGRAALLEGRRLWAGRAALAFDDLVVGCALAVLALGAAWLCLAVLLTVTAGCLRRTNGVVTAIAGAITPRLCRRLLGGLCGAALLAAPGTAVPVTAVPVTAVPGEGAPLPVPDRPTGAAARFPAASVSVRRGDSLWAIAACHLPAHADDAAVAAAWPVWFARNRVRLGPDPHLIHPGTRLVVPQRFHQTAKDTADDLDHRSPRPRPGCGG